MDLEVPDTSRSFTIYLAFYTGASQHLLGVVPRARRASLLRAEEIQTQGKAARPAVLSVGPPSAMSAAPGHLLEMQILGLTPHLLNGDSGVGPSNPCHPW